MQTKYENICKITQVLEAELGKQVGLPVPSRHSATAPQVFPPQTHAFGQVGHLLALSVVTVRVWNKTLALQREALADKQEMHEHSTCKPGQERRNPTHVLSFKVTFLRLKKGGDVCGGIIGNLKIRTISHFIKCDFLKCN